MITLVQLPELRHELVKAERGIPEDQRGSEMTRRHTATLRKASLWWASADMTKLAMDAADGLPPWTPDIAAPERAGLLWFAAPIGTSPAEPEPGFNDSGQAVESMLGSGDVHGVHWSIQDGEVLTLTFYGLVHDPEQRARSAPMWVDIYEIGVFSLAAWVAFDPQGEQISDPWARRIVHIIGAAWLLMQQPTVATQTRQRGMLYGGGARKPKKQDLIQVIDLRRLARGTKDTEVKHEGREYHTRWLVRGHWRQQRVGPGRKYTRPVFVAPHIKGPDGAPLKTERVNAWRR